MIAADTSSFVEFMREPDGAQSQAVRTAISTQALWLPPPVKTELLSSVVRGGSSRGFIEDAPLLPISEGYWERAGLNRRLLLSKGLKARLADTLIAQSCIDAKAALITRDADLRHFVRWCGLVLA